MSFLKTFAKRADEPYRPDPLPAPAPAPASAPASAPVGAEQGAVGMRPALELDDVKAAPAKALDLPPATEELGTAGLAKQLEALDPRALAESVAQQAATEPVKALRELNRMSREQGASVADIDKSVLDRYFEGGDVSDVKVLTADAGEVPVVDVLTAPMLSLPQEKQAQLEKEGRQVKRVRTYEDIAVDVVSSALKSKYVEAAGDKAAGSKQYRDDLQGLVDSGVLGKHEDGSPLTLREAETVLTREYGRRMYAGDAAQGVNLLLSLAQSAGDASLNLVESTFGKRLAAFTPFVQTDSELDTSRWLEPFSADEKGLAEDTAERAVRLEEEVAEVIPRNIIADAEERRTIGVRPSFSDLMVVRRPQVEAVAALAPEDQNLVALAARIGIDPSVLAGTGQAESQNNPTAVAFNLDEAREFMTPEQVAVLDRNLAEKYGYRRPKAGTDEPVHRGDDRYPFTLDQAIEEVRAVSPQAAARATAFGQFQVLGEHGNILGLAREVASKQTDRELTDDEAAELAFQMFKEQPREVSFALAERWWAKHPTLKRQVNQGDFSSLVETYTGAANNPTWVKNFEKGRARLPSLVAEAAEAAPPVPTAPFQSGVDLEPSLEARREQQVREGEASLFSLAGAGRLLASPLGTPQTDEEFERVTGVKATQVEGETFDMDDLTAKAFMPAPGTAAYEVSTRTWASILENAPESAGRLQDIGARSMGEGFEGVRREVESNFQADLARGEYADLSKEELRERIALTTLDIITSMQVAGAWHTPVFVSFDQMMGREEPGGFFGALSPRIEVLGRSGDEIIYRSETGSMQILSAIDAIPILGQSYNIGVLQNYIAPLAGERVAQLGALYDDPSWQNLAALGKSTAKQSWALTVPGLAAGLFSGELARLHQAGVRGVASRANFAEFTMDVTADMTDWAVSSTLGMDALRATGAATPEELVRAQDTLRFVGRFAGLAPGMFLAVVHPDAIGGMASGYRGAVASRRALLALPDGVSDLAPEVIGGGRLSKLIPEGLNGRQQLFAAGDNRMGLTVTIANDLEDLAALVSTDEAIDADRVMALLGRVAEQEEVLSELDELDASRRAVSAVLMDEIDRLTDESIAGAVAAGDTASAVLVDRKRAARVSAIVEDLADALVDSPDPEVAAKAQELQRLLESEEVDSQVLTLERGTARKATESETFANEVFSTGSRLRALRLAVELFDDIEDSFVIRRTAFVRDAATPSTTLGRVELGALDIALPEGITEVTAQNALQVFGALTEEELRALPKFRRLDDAEQQRVLQSRQALEDLVGRIDAAVTSEDYATSILNPEVASELRLDVIQSGLIDGDNYSPLIYRNRGSNKGNRFNQVVVDLMTQADRVTGSSTLQQDLFHGIAGILSYNLHRGAATQDVARRLVDARQLGVADDADEATRLAVVDAFLSTAPSTTRGKRLVNGLLSGTREGLMNLVGNTPLIGRDALRAAGVAEDEVQRFVHTGSKAVQRARMSQMTMDGADPTSVAGAVQLEVISRLQARRAAILDSLDEGVDQNTAVVDINAALARVQTDEWRAGFVAWMHEAKRQRAAGEAVTPFTDMPIAIDMSIFAGGRERYRVTQATKNFAEQSGFLKAYGFAGEETRSGLRLGRTKRTRKKKLSGREKDAALAVLDQMVRFMAKVDPSDSTETVNAKMAAWYSEYISGVRRTVSDAAYRKHLRSLEPAFYQALNDKVEELLGQPIGDFLAEALAQPGNTKVPEPGDLRRGRVAALFDESGERADDTVYEVYDLLDDGSVAIRPFGQSEVEPVVVAPTRLRVFDGEAREAVDEAIFRAQTAALDSLLPVMTEGEAQALFEMSLDELRQQVELRRVGAEPTMPTARFLDQRVRKAREGSGAWTASRVEMLAPEVAAAQLRRFAGDVALAAAADAISGTSAPRYLDVVIDYLRERRDTLLRGTVTKRDLVKSWIITAASQRAGAADAEKVVANYAAQGIDLRDLKGGVDFDKTFVENGRIRPEEAAAAWLLTTQGQEFLDEYDRGVFAADVFEQMLRARSSAHGIPSVLANVGSMGSSTNFGMRNVDGVEEVLKGINAAGGDPALLAAQLQRLQTIADGKVGFLKHFLGLGDTPTVDARALEFWLGEQLTPEGLQSLGFTTKAADTKQAFTSAARVSGILRERILGRMRELQAMGVGADLEPEVAAHILHHWIWDTVGGDPVTHEGLYSAMRLAQMPDGAQSAAAAGARTTDEVAEARRLWEEQGVESPYFKRWFGDSKVVDDEGQPLVVYHGTPTPTDEMSLKNVSARNYFGRGLSFTEDADLANTYAYSGGKGVGTRAAPELDAAGIQKVASRYRQMAEEIDVRNYRDPGDVAELLAPGPKMVDGLWDFSEKERIRQRVETLLQGPGGAESANEFIKSLARERIAEFEAGRIPVVFVPDAAGGLIDPTELAVEAGALPFGDVIEAYLSIKNPLPVVRYPNGLSVPVLPTTSADRLVRTVEVILKNYPEIADELAVADVVQRADDGRVVYGFVDLMDVVGIEDDAQRFLRDVNQAYYDEARRLGYDGVIAETDEGMEYVVFDPTQVKSVYNRGTFDPQDARLLYQRDDAPKATQQSLPFGPARADVPAPEKADDVAAQAEAPAEVPPELQGMAARAAARAERQQLPPGDESYEQVAARYEGLSEDKLRELLLQRDLAPSDVGFMRERSRVVDALVADDLRPLDDVVEELAPAAPTYGEMSKAELKDEIRKRNTDRKKVDRIKLSGSTETLQKALEADDAAQAGGVPQVGLTVPEKLKFGRGDRASVKLNGRQEVRKTSPLMPEDVVSYRRRDVDLVREERPQKRSVPRKPADLKKNYLAWRQAARGETEAEATATLDRILAKSKQSPEKTLIEIMDEERVGSSERGAAIAGGLASDLAEARDMEERLRRAPKVDTAAVDRLRAVQADLKKQIDMLVTVDEVADYRYRHSLDDSKVFATPEEAMADADQMLKVPAEGKPSFADVMPHLDETDLRVVLRALDAADNDGGFMNIATLRRVAGDIDDDRLKQLYEMLRQTGVLKGRSARRGFAEVSPRRAEAVSQALNAFFDPKAREERLLATIGLFDRVNALDLEMLTQPDLIQDDELRAFIVALRNSNESEYLELVEARGEQLTDELSAFSRQIKELERALARMQKSTPSRARSQEIRAAAIARAQRRLEELKANYEVLLEARQRGVAAMRDPSELPETASLAAAARARRSYDPNVVEGAAPPPPRGVEPGESVPDAPDAPKGMVYFFNDTSAILYAFKQADISTGLHEMSHVLRRQLDDVDMQVVARWVNSQLQVEGLPPIKLAEGPGGRLDFDFPANPESVIMAEELFARAFERYLREGEVPNSLLQSVFATMKDVLRRIYASLRGRNIDVYISEEMYGLFDKVFGAKQQIDFNDLLNGPQDFLNMQQQLQRGGTRRLTARIAEQEQLEDTPVDGYRQLAASLDDYRARGVGRLPFVSPDEGLTQGSVASRTGDRAMQLGPVSRRVMSLDEVTAARQKGEISAGLRAADNLAVWSASIAQGVAYIALLGGDSQRILRLLPANLRSFVAGPARELEEFSSELSMRMVDLSRQAPRQRVAGVRRLIKYARGESVRMVTGAQRGQQARANLVNTEDHFVRMLVAFYDKLSPEARAAVAEDASRYFSGRKQRVGALSGFWRGYGKRVEGDDPFKDGLTLSAELDELLKTNAVKESVGLSQMQEEMLTNLYNAISGLDTGIPRGGRIDGVAEALAAEMAFLSGSVPVTRGGVTFTLADLDNERSFFDYLFFGGEITKDGKTLRLKGINGLTKTSPGRAVGTLGIVFQAGYVAGVYDDLRKIGFGLTAADYRLFAKYLGGDGASLTTTELARAKEMFRMFGRTKFDPSPLALGDFYVPRQTRVMIMEQQKQALRQMGLSQTKVGIAKTLASSMLAFYQSMIIFGSVFQRQAFKFMSTIDLGLQVGLNVGAREGAAAAARASALTVLSALGLERGAEMVEATLGAAYTLADRLPPEMFKARLREWVTAQGDRAVNAVTDLMGASKFRVEVNPILENTDDVFVIGGRVYTAKSLRKVFTQAGMYSNAFKEMRHDWWRGTPGVDAERRPTSAANRQFLDSAKLAAKDFLDDPRAVMLGTGRRALSTVFEHGVESADAWSDLERTGAAVTLMEFGYSPLDAAKLVVESVYDYRGSMTEGDRNWVRRLLMPFWAFRKNANTQALNMMASPQGAFRIMALRRAVEFGPEALTAVLYEGLLQPYDVDVSLMTPRVRDVYYQTRMILELGYGDAPDEQVLAEYREQLPEEARGLSDEELLDYSFDGWTIRDGFKGYHNVPERFRIGFRALLSGNTSSLVRQRTGLYRLSDALAQQKVANFYVQEGAKMSARAARGESGLPAWAAKRPTVQVPIPVLNESAREVIEYLRNTGMSRNDVPDPGDSLYFVLPDNFIMSAIDHAGALLATTTVLAQMGLKGLDDESEVNAADARRLINAVAPILDIRSEGSAQLELLAALARFVDMGERTPRQRLHPIVARAIEGSLSVSVPFMGDRPVNVPGSAFAARVLGASPAGEVIADEGRVGKFSRMYARPVKVVARDAAGLTRDDPGFDTTTARRSVEVVDSFTSGTAFDYTVPHSGPEGEERLAYTPYLYGASAITFPMTFLGQFNKWLFENVGDGPLETSMIQNGDAENFLLNLAAEFYRGIGGRVSEADYGRTASMERLRE